MTFTFIVLLLMGSGCQKSDHPKVAGGKTVVVTTTIAGDVVRMVAGDALNVEVLLPYGASPHDYNPSPSDVSVISKADLVFINGLGLEKQIVPLFSNLKRGVNVISLSSQVDTRMLVDDDHSHEGHDHGEADPHVWTDPVNVIGWVNVAASSLADLMPDSTSFFATNALNYIDSLGALDRWITSEVAELSDRQKKLVTDHKVFGYFADKYAFQQVGAVIPSFSSLSEPSARDIAQLENEIVAKNIKTIFVGKQANQTISTRISSDLDLEVVELLTGSLEEEGEASTYIGYMKYNVGKIVKALGQ